MAGQKTAQAPAEGSPAATRSSTFRSEAWLYAVAVVLYVALGVMTRSVVLNWIVGPLFPFLVVYLLPRCRGRIRRWRARTTGRGELR